MKPNSLKVERVLRGWSQSKVADAVGTNTRTVIRWEQGQSLPYPYYREQLCALFGKNARELGLLEDDEGANTKKEVSSDLQRTLAAAVFPIVDPAIPASLGMAARLVGRESLFAKVKQQLVGEQRTVIALQGLPGMGKTSLAVALTADQALRNHFHAGILWAGLGQEPDVLGQLVRWGKLLGVTPKDVGNVNSREAWGKALHDAIGTRRLLLVIDDAWSVEEALAFRVGGSRCYHVLTTRLPQVAFAFAREETQIVPELPDAAALALLAQFVPQLVQEDEKSALALVQAVSGSPLAVTLMGNYLAALAFTGQRRRLHVALAHLRDTEQRLRLSAPVAIAERPPCLPSDTPISLYAAISVSTQRLRKQERDVLHALAVFPPKPASFSEEAALAVSAAATETLDSLWDAGLLESSGSGRYTLHQTIADFANYPTSDTTAQHRLVHYIVGYIAEHENDYDALEREERSILAAFDLAETLNLQQELLQGVLGCVAFMRVRGHYTLAQRLLSHCLTLTVTRENPVLGRQVLRYLAEFADVRGEYALAESYCREGLSLCRSRASEMGQQRDAESALLTTLGLVAFHRGDYAQAKGLFEEGLCLARRLEDRTRICTVLTHLGRVLQYQGDYSEAKARYLEGLNLARESGDHELLNRLLIYLGGVTRLQGDVQQAQCYYEESLVLGRSLGHREHVGAVLNDLGIMAAQRGEMSAAIAYYQEGLELVRQIGQCADRCLLLANLGSTLVEHGKYEQAVGYLREGIELARGLENRNRLTLLLTNLGSALGNLGDYEQAHSCFRESLSLARAIGSPWYIYGTLLEWGEIHLLFAESGRERQQELHAAAAAFSEILEYERNGTGEGEPELLAGAEYGLARVAALQGNRVEALRLAFSCEAHFAAIGSYKAGIVREWWEGRTRTSVLVGNAA